MHSPVGPGAAHSIYEEPWHAAKWQSIVVRRDAKAADEWGRSPEALAKEVSAGVTLADVLGCLAVHTAYHRGKIVALRPLIGAWPPRDQLGIGA